jgi:hypothetical protein
MAQKQLNIGLTGVQQTVSLGISAQVLTLYNGSGADVAVSFNVNIPAASGFTVAAGDTQSFPVQTNTLWLVGQGTNVDIIATGPPVTTWQGFPAVIRRW